MSTVISLRLGDDRAEYLRKVARQMGHTPARDAAMLLE